MSDQGILTIYFSTTFLIAPCLTLVIAWLGEHFPLANAQQDLILPCRNEKREWESNLRVCDAKANNRVWWNTNLQCTTDVVNSIVKVE